ncbi:hypothetical protein [Anatilimnocola floriformis]|uniref:hypothetical protein n=1 Tax=Anatilimnocola floriformis TaxID=2948575 RepID=UPI0020C39C03|nr:hypothetical protein [Anatilimnocola floriformis]
MRRNLAWLIVGLLFVGLTAARQSAHGEDFRVDTEVFRGNSKEPIAEILTIFQSGNVYDFQLAGPQEITIFEPRRGVVTLLNVEHKKKAVVETLELINAAISMQAAAAAGSNPVFAAAAQPAFEVKSSEFKQNNSDFTKLVFTGNTLKYTVTGQQAHTPGAANDYRYFSDLSARLSSLRVGGLPAGARLEVNAEIAKHGLLPTEVERIIQETRFGKSEVRTQHLVVWKLSQEDRKRIDTACGYLVDQKFETIDFNQFCALVRNGK